MILMVIINFIVNVKEYVNIVNHLPPESKSYWQDSVSFPTYPSLAQDEKYDICIVGAGITGLTTAFLLSQEGFSVCLLEANRVLSGTTSLTTAKITAQHGLFYADFIEQFGIEKAKQYYEANERALTFIYKMVQEHQIDCEFQQEDAYIYTNTDQEVKKIEKEWDAYERIGIEGALCDTTSLPFSIKKAIKMNKQALFHPLKYAQALLELCEKKEVTIYESTRAINVEYNKHPSVLTETRNRITCQYVVQATQYPFYDGLGYYPTRLYASRSYAMVVKSDKKIETGMYLTAENPVRSIRPITIENEQLMLLVGESHKTGQTDETMMQYYQALEKYGKEHFSLTDILYRWSAQDYISLDEVPYIGPVTKHQKNIFVATGLKKWGMTNGTSAALLIRDMINDQANEAIQLFSPSRSVKITPTIEKFLTVNADVAKHLASGKFKRETNDIHSLTNNEACITTIDLNRIGVYKDEDGKLHAVDTTCTHLGCEVNWNNAEKSWDCPCHGSRFDYNGNVIQGPAVKPLEKIKWEEITE